MRRGICQNATTSCKYCCWNFLEIKYIIVSGIELQYQLRLRNFYRFTRSAQSHSVRVLPSPSRNPATHKQVYNTVVAALPS